jgi:hypothetical protein
VLTELTTGATALSGLNESSPFSVWYGGFCFCADAFVLATVRSADKPRFVIEDG